MSGQQSGEHQLPQISVQLYALWHEPTLIGIQTARHGCKVAASAEGQGLLRKVSGSLFPRVAFSLKAQHFSCLNLGTEMYRDGFVLAFPS